VMWMQRERQRKSVELEKVIMKSGLGTPYWGEVNKIVKQNRGSQRHLNFHRIEVREGSETNFFGRGEISSSKVRVGTEHGENKQDRCFWSTVV